MSDKQEEIIQYERLAREARALGNEKKAAQYYNALWELCPDNWEYVFYSAYFTALSGTIGQIPENALLVGHAISNAMEKIDNDKSFEGNKTDAYKEIADSVAELERVFRENSDPSVAGYTNYTERKKARFGMLLTIASALAKRGIKDGAAVFSKYIYTNLGSFEDIVNIPREVELLQPGEGKRLMQYQLDEAKKRASQWKGSFGTMIGISVVAWVVTLMMLNSMYGWAIGLGALIFTLCIIPFASGKKKACKELEELQYKVDHLGD